MRRTLIVKSLVAAASGVAALGIAEGTVRLAAPQWSDQWKMYRVDPVWGRGLKPGVKNALIHGHTGEFAFRFSTNRQGLRMDYEVTPAPATGYVRVLVVGDSFTFGYGVNQGESYPAQLQAVMRQAGRPVEVINAGFAGGFTTDTQFVFTREAGLRVRPTHVLVGVCLSNDFDDLRQTRWRVADGTLTAVVRRTDDVPDWIQRSALANLLVKGGLPRLRELLDARARARGDLAPLEPMVPVCELPVPESGNMAAGPLRAALPLLEQSAVDAWSDEQRLAWLITAWSAHAHAAGYELVLLLIPDADEVQWPSSPQRLAYRASVRQIFRDAAAAAGVRVLDPVVDMRNYVCSTGDALYFARDGHWRAAGHTFVGRWLARELIPGVPQFAGPGTRQLS